MHRTADTEFKKQCEAPTQLQGTPSNVLNEVIDIYIN